MLTPIRPTAAGSALFSYGFRPFFLLAGLYAVLVVPLWMAVWSGHLALNSPFAPIDWHIHELLFGYVSAVMAGFLFTAIGLAADRVVGAVAFWGGWRWQGCQVWPRFW